MTKEYHNKYNFNDYLYFAVMRIVDYLLLPYWKFRLKSLGKNSILKPGVKILGSGNRVTIGNNFKIWNESVLAVGKGQIIIGDNGHFGNRVYINATEGIVKIGNNVAIAPYTQIYSYSNYSGHIKQIGEEKKVANVYIGNNVFVGSNVVILPGITIHDGAIIAAGAVVVKDVKSNTIVGGVPAKEIRK